jgi:hypothetical protein
VPGCGEDCNGCCRDTAEGMNTSFAVGESGAVSGGTSCACSTFSPSPSPSNPSSPRGLSPGCSMGSVSRGICSFWISTGTFSRYSSTCGCSGATAAAAFLGFSVYVVNLIRILPKSICKNRISLNCHSSIMQ